MRSIMLPVYITNIYNLYLYVYRYLKKTLFKQTDQLIPQQNDINMCNLLIQQMKF
jgi:uncharacterized membrane protein YqhA